MLFGISLESHQQAIRILFAHTQIYPFLFWLLYFRPLLRLQLKQAFWGITKIVLYLWHQHILCNPPNQNAVYFSKSKFELPGKQWFCGIGARQKFISQILQEIFLSYPKIKQINSSAFQLFCLKLFHLVAVISSANFPAWPKAREGAAESCTQQFYTGIRRRSRRTSPNLLPWVSTVRVVLLLSLLAFYVLNLHHCTLPAQPNHSCTPPYKPAGAKCPFLFWAWVFGLSTAMCAWPRMFLEELNPSLVSKSKLSTAWLLQNLLILFLATPGNLRHFWVSLYYSMIFLSEKNIY